MFRMKFDAFNLLCQKIEARIGEERFRNEIYCYENWDMAATVPPIVGEVKVALSIRMLAGGSYLDLVPLFDVSSSGLYVVFAEFLDWITLAFTFPLVGWLREGKWEMLEGLANEFAERSNGVFYGPFSALDGCALQIQCPMLSEVPDPGNYYCRKGFYALNLQAICDKRKRFLWSFPSNKGSTHDAAAWAGSKLYEMLMETHTSDELYNRGLFIAGDSAYSLAMFLVVPHSTDEAVNEDIDDMKDSFNFYLLSCRIFNECAFGELVMIWGILWRTLCFDIKKSIKVINVCMLLHNFIVKTRDESECNEDEAVFRDLEIPLDDVHDAMFRRTGELAQAIATDNNEPRTGGRPSKDKTEQRQLGMQARRRLTVKLATNDMKRPMQHHMKRNKHGNTYFG